MEETLEQGLQNLFGEGAASGARGTARAASTTAAAEPAARAATEARDALVQQAVQLYERAKAAQRADDWAAYGEAMTRLGDVLRRLRGQ